MMNNIFDMKIIIIIVIMTTNFSIYGQKSKFCDSLILVEPDQIRLINDTLLGSLLVNTLTLEEINALDSAFISIKANLNMEGDVISCILLKNLNAPEILTTKLISNIPQYLKYHIPPKYSESQTFKENLYTIISYKGKKFGI